MLNLEAKLNLKQLLVTVVLLFSLGKCLGLGGWRLDDTTSLLDSV